MTWDAAGRLIELTNFNSLDEAISGFRYTHDSVGNRTSVTEAEGPVVEWKYDRAYQLTRETRYDGSGWAHLSVEQWAALSVSEWAALDVGGTVLYSTTHVYDPVGNRTLKIEDGSPTTYVYDPANRLETAEDSSGVTTYTFDADGNERVVESPLGERTTNTWDFENQNTLVELPSGEELRYTYNADLMRVAEEDPLGNARTLVWDGQNVIAELDEVGAPEVRYTLEPEQYGNLVSQRRDADTAYHHYDALGSTMELSDAAQAVTDEYRYKAYGETFTSSGASENPYQWVGALGYRFADVTARHSLRRREYQARIARFLSEDPIDAYTLNKPLNGYSYVWNSPVNYIDPSGLKAQDHHWFPRNGGDWHNSRGQQDVNRLCCRQGISFNIHDYTTTLPDSRRGTPHYTVHHVLKYNPLVVPYYKSSTTCCQLLTSMIAAMGATWAKLQTYKFNPPLPATPPLHPYGKTKPNTWPKLLAQWADACGHLLTLPCGSQYDVCKYRADEAYADCLERKDLLCWLGQALRLNVCAESLKGCIYEQGAKELKELVAANPELVLITIGAIVVVVAASTLAPGVAPALIPAVAL